MLEEGYIELEDLEESRALAQEILETFKLK